MQAQSHVGILETLLFAGILSAASQAQTPLGSELTYQGRLVLNGSPVNDTADLEFTLWDDPSAGAMVGATQALTDIVVVDGVFTVELDFGVAAFNGDERWLEIAVRSPAGVGDYTLLSPRQLVTAAPYALQTRGIFVSEVGDVGIGTTAPTESLHIIDGNLLIDTSASNEATSTATIKGARHTGSTGLDAAYGTLNFENYDTSDSQVEYVGASIRSRNREGSGGTSGSDDGDLLFATTRDLNLVEQMVITSDGNVGIRTTDPDTGLQVVGNEDFGGITIQTQDNLLAQGLRYRNSSTGYAWTINRVDAGQNRAHLVFSGGTTDPDPSALPERMRIDRDGKVGIGTATPTTALDVNGTVQATALVGDGSGLTNVPSVWTENGNDIHYNAGNVGIGTATPTTALDVNGTVNATALVGDGSGLTDVPSLWNEDDTDIYYNAGNVAVGTSSADAQLHVRNSLRVSSDSFAPVIELVNDDDGDSFDLRYVRGAERLDIRSNSQAVMGIQQDGNIGIGTSSPTAKLEVAGTVNATAFVGDGSGLTNIDALSGTTGDIRITNGISLRTLAVLLDQEQDTGLSGFGLTEDSWQSFTAGLTGDLSSVGVFRDSDGPEGIIELYEGEGTLGTLLSATTIPAMTDLEWQYAEFTDPIPVVAGNQYSIRVLTGPGGHRWRIGLGDPYPGGRAGENADVDYRFRTFIVDPSAEMMDSLRIDAGTGNVGIGTASPSSALDVNGTVNATAFVGDGSGLTNLAGAQWAESGNDIYYDAGNVGIGTTTPTDAILDVEGDMHINDNDLYLRAGSDQNHGIGWYGNGKTFAGSTHDGAVVYGYSGGSLGSTNGGEKRVLTWNAAGNVGIGTNSPTTKLDVRGDIAFGSDGLLHAPGFDRKVLIVAGRINQDGTIDTTVTTSGAIASSVRDTDGDYTITLAQGAFSNTPIITITCEEAGNGDDFRLATTSAVSATGFHVKIKDRNGDDDNAPFHFTAIGER